MFAPYPLLWFPPVLILLLMSVTLNLNTNIFLCWAIFPTGVFNILNPVSYFVTRFLGTFDLDFGQIPNVRFNELNKYFPGLH